MFVVRRLSLVVRRLHFDVGSFFFLPVVKWSSLVVVYYWFRVCCDLFIACLCLLCVVCWSFFAARRLLFGVYCLLVFRLSHIVCRVRLARCSLLVDCCLLFAVLCLLVFVICLLVCVVRCLSCLV